MPPDMQRVAKRLGLTFKDPDLLRQALIHRSYLRDGHPNSAVSNERLEFLGDAVVGFVVAEWVYQTLPDASEGELTSRRSALVRRDTLAAAARRLGLGQALLLGKGAGAGARDSDSVLSSTLEAVVAAVYLDGGLEAARQFLAVALAPEIAHLAEAGVVKDAKSRFQEQVQARWHVTPGYRTLAARGPDHAKVFVMEVSIGNEPLGTGEGPTKQLAQRAAAEAGLRRLTEGWEPATPPSPEGNTRSVTDAVGA